MTKNTASGFVLLVPTTPRLLDKWCSQLPTLDQRQHCGRTHASSTQDL